MRFNHCTMYVHLVKKEVPLLFLFKFALIAILAWVLARVIAFESISCGLKIFWKLKACLESFLKKTWLMLVMKYCLHAL